ncbi:MAG: reverse transcriptase family protein, partial [gamma proteobacterium symbiont of Lucinoma myriamae]|nr:reverse transcriptase family protein [gamma proteobacterium symbiont of Lucinoma myriamae]
KIKIGIREVSKNYSIGKAVRIKDRCKMLENNLSSLHKIQDQSLHTNVYVNNETLKTENELNTIYIYKAKGAQIRAKAEWIEKGEKNTKLFLALEKNRQIKKNIQKIKTENGQTVTDNAQILQEQVRFYENLYSAKINDTVEMKSYLNYTHLTKTLTPSESETCEKDFTSAECKNSLFAMKLNKSPGSDGISVEFYQTFWQNLSTHFMNSVKETELIEQLSPTQKQGILSLIYKSGDPTELSNWRPITLLNVDYKIIARVLAQRLQKIISKVVNTDQNGYIRNRFIGFNIRQIQDVIDYAEDNNLNGTLLFLDFQKAFDSIEWEFMYLTLEQFGFGKNFINWVKILNKDVRNCAMNNGWISESFKISRGIRQGCPISALLYILSAEIMAENIRNNKTINGIKVGRQKKEIKLTQLADDTTIFLESENDIPNLLEEIKRFSKASGLNLNTLKTKGLLLGRNRQRRNKIHDIDFSEYAVKSLGIYFCSDKKECSRLNWNNLIEDIQNLLNSWKRRKLTMFGKITVLKTLAMSKCNYLLQSIYVSNEVLSKLESLFFKFLWNDKNDKIKRKQMVQTYDKGGMKMVDIRTQLKTFQIKWVNRLIMNDNANWKIIPRYYFDKYGKDFIIFRMNIGHMRNLSDVNLPNFYKDTLETWVDAGG